MAPPPSTSPTLRGCHTVGTREKELSRVELFESIRRQHRDEGLSIRELAQRHHVHRRTVRQALINAVPPQRKAPERAAPALGAHEVTVRAWLEADLEVPRKQRHTARRVWQRLCEEVDAEVAESTVRALVGRIRAELGLDAAACGVTIPQDHRPGEEAECDFGEFYAWIAGAQLRLYLFVMRLSFSGRGFVVAFANQAQEAFLEGHVLAFEHFGGVPAGQIRYDNLKDAVRRILVGRDRVETERFIALRSHYGFDSFFCEPGIKGAHEKGGVEGEVGRFRRNWLVPVPVVGSLAELNGLLVGWMAADDARHVGRRAQPVAEAFALEQCVLHPLPGEPFDSARLLGAKADAKARVCVLGVVVFGAGPAGAAPGPGPPWRQPAGGPRRWHGRRGPPPQPPQGHPGPGAGPLPGDPGPQARRVRRLGHACPSPRRRRLHCRPPEVLGLGSPRPWRRGGHPRADRGLLA